jgi:hypothetical protein
MNASILQIGIAIIAPYSILLIGTYTGGGSLENGHGPERTRATRLSHRSLVQDR